jgi:hypothetical protein
MQQRVLTTLTMERINTDPADAPDAVADISVIARCGRRRMCALLRAVAAGEARGDLPAR